MILTKEGDRFVCYTNYENKDLPKDAGFTWDKSNNYWYTTDPVIASQLYGYGDTSCKAELQALSKIYDKTIQDSKSRGCEINIPSPAGKNYLPYQKAAIKFILERWKIIED